MYKSEYDYGNSTLRCALSEFGYMIYKDAIYHATSQDKFLIFRLNCHGQMLVLVVMCLRHLLKQARGLAPAT